MPRRKKQPAGDAGNENKPKILPRALGSEAPWGGYINLNIDDEKKKQYQSVVGTASLPVSEMLLDALDQGYKFSVSYDAENFCYIAALTGAIADDVQLRGVLTARSDILDDATALLMFKHWTLMNGAWSDYLPKSGKLRSWG